MVDRPHKPSALAKTPGLPPQASVAITHGSTKVTATLPSGESVEVLLFGATVTSWKDAAGEEKLWLSDAAKLDGSKAVRGGIPLVFPVFGTAPDHPATSKLPQHGFARSSMWEFLGKSTSEGDISAASSSTKAEDLSCKLDFGLSSSNLDDKTRALWPFDFSLIYSVTLNRGSLTTSLLVTNEGDKPFECQMLLHTYFRVKDISKVEVTGAGNASYIDKVDGAKTKSQDTDKITFSGEVDRVYSTPNGAKDTISILEGGAPRFDVKRDNLDEVVVWNPWINKAAGMGDFEPKDGYKNMVCVEAGSVKGWQTLEAGDAFVGAQTVSLH